MSVQSIYLDVCILCRPFDDQQQVRIRLETEALELILAYIRQGDGPQLVSSPVHTIELNAIRDAEEKQYLLLLLDQLGTKIEFDLPAIRKRAEALTAAGMGVADAAHVAFAEFAQADFISVDDRLLKKCRQMDIQIWTGSPLAFCDKENLR